MTLDPTQERERVHAAYPRPGVRTVIAYVFTIAVVFVAARGDWTNFGLGAGVVTIFAVGGQVISFRLRRNADRFADRRP